MREDTPLNIKDWERGVSETLMGEVLESLKGRGEKIRKFIPSLGHGRSLNP